MILTDSTLGERIKKRRIVQGLTQRELSKKSGISASDIRMFERDWMTPDKSEIENIATALDVCVSDLMNIPPRQRNLDGVYFFAQRNGARTPVCFSDLTELEMDNILAEATPQFVRNLCKILGKVLRKMGESLDVEGIPVSEDKTE